jgi:hypothetical protein
VEALLNAVLYLLHKLVSDTLYFSLDVAHCLPVVVGHHPADDLGDVVSEL